MPSLENQRTGIQYHLTQAESRTVQIDEGIKRLNRAIGVVSLGDPILEAPSGRAVLPNAEYRKGLEEAIGELPSFVDRGEIHNVVGPGGKVNVVGLKNLCDSLGDRFADDWTSVMGTVAERDEDHLPRASMLLDRLPIEEGRSYRSKLADLELVAARQEMPPQTRYPREEELPGAAAEFMFTQGGVEFPIRVIDAAVFPDDQKDIKIHLRDPAVKLTFIDLPDDELK